MFEIVILLFRYAFVLLTAAFLTSGVLLIQAERGAAASRVKTALTCQRIAIITLHTAAFVILTYKNGPSAPDYLTAGIGAGAAALFIASFKLKHPREMNAVFFLLDIGLIMITRLDPYLGGRQLISAAVGFLCLLAVPLALKIIKQPEKLHVVYMLIGAALTAAPLFWGEAKFGAYNWITVGSFSFQPSEAVKILFVLYMAAALSKSMTVKNMALPLAFGLFTVIMLIVQRDLGAALIFFTVFACMLYAVTGKAYYPLGMAAAGIAVCAAAYRFVPSFFTHVTVRINAWLNPWRDIDGGGYQIAQALFAVGSWGVWGSGLTRGYPERIPISVSDFIFPAVCEEFGVLFGIALIGAVALCIYYLYRAAAQKKHIYDMLVSFGCVFTFACQNFLVIGGTIKLIPHTGVTLPFVSHGGSSLIISMIMTGLIVHEKSG